MLIRLLDNLLKVRPEEAKKTSLAFLYLFTAIGAFIIGRIARTVLFLEIPDYKDKLPMMYVLIAVTVSAVMYGYARVERKLRRDQTNAITLVALIAVTLLFRFMLHDAHHGMYWAFYVWVEVYGSFLIVQFWTFVNEIFHSRQAKRLFAIIGGGGVLSNVFIGFAISGSVKSLGTENLLYVLSGLLVISLAAVIMLGRASKTELAAAQERGPAQKAKGSGKVFTTRHVKLIAVVVVLTYIVSTLVDYQFQVIIGDSIPGKDDRSAYFGNFFGVTGIIAAVVQFSLTSRILERFGVLVALLALPLAMLSGSVGILTYPLLSGLWAASFTKGSENVLRYTLNDSTLQLLYLPVPAQIRGRAKAWIDGILKPLSIGGAGIILGVLVGQLDKMTGVSLGIEVNVYQLSWLVVAALLFWIVAQVQLRKEYVASLLSTLQRRRLNFADAKFQINDDATLKTLHAALTSDKIGEVLHALELLPFVSGKAREGLHAKVAALLDHHDEAVRVAALNALGTVGAMLQLERIAPLLEDSSPQVRAAATLTYCALAKERSILLVHPLLEDPSTRVRAAAVAGLIRYGSLDGMLASADTLKHMLSSQMAAERERAAWILGEIGVQHFYQPLVPLLDDKLEAVRSSAIVAAGRLKTPELIPSLVKQLAQPQLSSGAAQALASFGAQILEIVGTLLMDRTQPSVVRAHACKILGRLADGRSVELLAQNLADADPQVRGGAVSALSHIVHHSPGARIDKGAVERATKNESEYAFQLLALSEDLALTDDDFLLRDALEHRLRQAQKRIFGLLALRYEASTIEIVSRNLRSTNVATRANAVEVLDNLLDKDEKPFLLALFEDGPPGRKLQAVAALFSIARHDRAERLVALLDGGDDWLKVCAAYAVGKKKQSELEPKIKLLLDSPSAICRETAIVVLKELSKDGSLKGRLERLKEDPARAVRSYATHVLAEMG